MAGDQGLGGSGKVERLRPDGCDAGPEEGPCCYVGMRTFIYAKVLYFYFFFLSWKERGTWPDDADSVLAVAYLHRLRHQGVSPSGQEAKVACQVQDGIALAQEAGF